MDGCKLIIEYEVDCTFKFPDEDTDKSVIVVHDKENETFKGKIRHSSLDIYFEYTAYSVQWSSPIIGELLGAARKKAPIKKASTDRE